MNTKWITLSLVMAVLLVGAVVFAWKPGGERRDRAETRDIKVAGDSQAGHPASTVPVVSCGGSLDPTVSRDELNDKYKRAQSFVSQKRFAAALPELRAVAILDPSFPGVNLEISDALLQLKRPDEAKEAVDAQIATSQCLSKLPADAVDAYCGAEMPQMSRTSCSQRLSHVMQTSQLQAAIVHLELGHESGAAPVASAATAYLAPQPQPRLSIAPAAARPKPIAAEARAVPEPRKSSVDRTLIDGAGTDSSLGAYSKPQP